MEPTKNIFEHLKDFFGDFKKATLVVIAVFIVFLFAAGATVRDENGNLAAVATIQKVLFLPFNEELEPGSALDIGVPGTNITVRITVKSVSANKTVLSVEQVSE